MKDCDLHLKKATGIDDVVGRLEPQSPFGSALCRHLSAIADHRQLEAEYDNIEKCMEIDRACFGRFTKLLRQYRDITNTMKRCQDCQTLDECELFELKGFAILSQELFKLPKPELAGVCFCDLSDVVLLLDPNREGTASFTIYDAYSLELVEIRLRKSKIEREIYHAQGDDHMLLLQNRAAAAEEEKQAELLVRQKLTKSLSFCCERLFQTAESIARFDLSLAKAKMAAEYAMCRPFLSKECCVRIKNGFHPLVKEAVEKRGHPFCPVTLDCKEGATVITGSNMGGKTVALRMAALNCMMAGMGFFAFADSFTFRPPDFILFLSDEDGALESALSTFGSEVAQLKELLDMLKTGSGIVLIDEFARGTNPVEGGSLVKALVSYLTDCNSVSILTTHYGGVSAYAGAHYQVRGLKDANLKDCSPNCADYTALIAEKMDYTLVESGEDDVPRDALRICSFFGVDEELIKSAQKFLKDDIEREKSLRIKEDFHGRKTES